MKFQGEEPSFEDLDKARDITQQAGYRYFRAKHFFNNKNEVTLMISYDGDEVDEINEDVSGESLDGETSDLPILGKSMLKCLDQPSLD